MENLIGSDIAIGEQGGSGEAAAKVSDNVIASAIAIGSGEAPPAPPPTVAVETAGVAAAESDWELRRSKLPWAKFAMPWPTPAEPAEAPPPTVAVETAGVAPAESDWDVRRSKLPWAKFAMPWPTPAEPAEAARDAGAEAAQQAHGAVAAVAAAGETPDLR